MSGTSPKSLTTVSSSVRNDEIVLEWTIHPACREHKKLIGIGLAAFMVAVVGYWMLDATLPVVVMLVMLTASISDFLFPTTYTLTTNGARASSLFNRTFIEWSSVRRVCAVPDGIKLSPFVKPSRLDAFRGVYLRYDRNEPEVLAVIDRLRKVSHDRL